MKKSIKSIIAACGCICVACVSGGVLCNGLRSVADTSLDLSTVYRLTLTDYEVPNYTTKVTAKNPEGDEVILHRGILPLDMQGTYTLYYGEENVKYVVSLLHGAVKDLTFTDELAEAYVAGAAVALPTPVFEKVDGYAHAEASYRVEIEKDGEILKSFLRGEGESVNYFFAEVGEYDITYFSVDEFGIEKQEESFSIQVQDEEEVFFEKLPETANFGEEVEIGFPYGYYQGETYAVKTTVTSPDGVSTEWKARKYTFFQTGTYVFSYASTVNGKEVTASQSVSVFDKDTAFTFLSGAGAINYGATLPACVDKYYSEHTTLSDDKTAVKITSKDTSPRILYNKVIDLSTLSAEENLISFFPVSAEGKDLGGIRIRLTDVYDPAKSVALYVRKNPYEVKHSTALVEFNGVSASIANDPSPTVYGTLRTEANSAFIYYQSSLIPAQYEGVDMRMFTLRYHYAENAFYAYSRDKNYKFGHQILLDFDDSSKISYQNLFHGFTTGEVALSIELDRNVNAGIYVAEIAGEKVGSEKDLSKVIINVNKPQRDVHEGAVNYVYNLPTASLFPYLQSNDKIEISLNKGGQDCSSLLNGYSFTPTEAGVYEAVYRCFYRGEEVVNRLSITVNETPHAISVEVPLGESVEYNTRYYIPKIPMEGGSTLQTLYTVKLNGAEVLPDENGGYFVGEGGLLTVYGEVTDEIGFKRQFSYDVAVRNGIVLDMETAMFSSVRVGQTVTFPAFTAQSVDGTLIQDEPKTRILVNGETVLTDERSYTVSGGSALTAEYQVDTGDGFTTVKSYEIPVLPQNIAATSDLFTYSEGMQTCLLENNLLFTMTASDTSYAVQVPHVVSTYNLAFAFVVNNDTFCAEAFTVRFADVNGENALTVRFFEVDAAKKQAKFTVNDGQETFVLKGTPNKYSEQCGDAETAAAYKGKSYVAFALELNEAGKYFRNATTKEQVAKFDSFVGGGVFTGFSYNVCNIDVKIEGVTDYTELGIASISNQQFNYLIESFDFECFDNKGPQINVYGNRGLVEAELGARYELATAKGFDVIQGTFGVRVSVKSGSGKKLINNLSADVARTVTLEERGYYTVEYVSTDSVGNKSTVSFKIVVADKVAPTLTVNGTYAAKYKVGENLTVLGFNAADGDGETLAYVYLQTPDGIQQVKAGDVIALGARGRYTLVYRVEDEWLNTTRVVFTFEVE